MKVTLFFILFFTTVLGCAHSLKNAQPGYPKEWWAPVPREDAAGWEILPQDAGPGEVILSKRNELGILSNFAPTPFVMDGQNFGSVEGFWQMMKYPENAQDERFKDPKIVWAYTRDQVGKMSAFDAKKAGSLANENMKKLGISWVSYRGKKINYLENSRGDFFKLIFRAEVEKLNQNAQVKNILLRTGNLILKPDHHQSPDSAPAWKYFDIWMEIRAQL